SIPAPVSTFSKMGPVETTRGGIGLTPFNRSLHLATRLMGLASAGIPTVKPERTGLLMRLEATRKFGGEPGIWSKSTSGDGSLKANISVRAPISRFQSAPWISLTCPSSRAASINSRRSLKGIYPVLFLGLKPAHHLDSGSSWLSHGQTE